MDILEKYKKLSANQRIFLYFLIFADFYYSLRYILKYGSAISPSNYSLTPAYYQYGKYFFAVIFFLLFAYLIYKNKHKIINIFNNRLWITPFLFTGYLLLSLFKVQENFSFALTQNLKMTFVLPVLFIIPALFLYKKDIINVLKVFIPLSVIYHVSYSIIMIANFYLFHRLPGLAFNDVLGRFGGGWDDPNSFAALIVLYIVIVLVLHKRKNLNYEKMQAIMLIILTVLVVYTFSATGIAGLVLIFILINLIKKFNIRIIWLIPLVGLIMLLIFFKLNYLDLIIKNKLGSSMDHMANIETVSSGAISINNSNILFGNNVQVFHENFYMQFYYNYGAIGILLFFSLIITFLHKVWRSFKESQSENDKNIYLIILIYAPVFLLMNINIPYLQIFPMNLFFWIMISYIFMQSTSKNEER